MRAMRIVLLIANGGWLLAFVAALFVVATEGLQGGPNWSLLFAIPVVAFTFLLAGNVAYIWRSRPHAHNEKGASASHAPTPHG